MDDNSYITINSVDSVISEKEQKDEFSVDETFFKDFFDSKDSIISPIRNNNEEINNKNILENELKISNESNNIIFHSTPIHKVLSSNVNVINNNNENIPEISYSNIISEQKENSFEKENNNNTPQNEKRIFLSPPSQPGFKHLRKFDNEDLYVKVKNLLNCSKDILNIDISNKNGDNKIENVDNLKKKCEPLINKKENINLNEFKIDTNKFDKYSIFNNKEYDISFERVNNLNSLFHKEIEKQKKKNNNENEALIDNVIEP